METAMKFPYTAHSRRGQGLFLTETPPTASPKHLFHPLFPRNPLFPRLRSGHRHLQRLSPQKQIPSNKGPAKLFAELGAVISNFMRRHVKAGVAALSLAAITGQTDAALVHAGADINAHRALGVANSNDVLWVESEYNGQTLRFSAIRINDYYAITVGHGVYGATSGLIIPNEVGNGTNFLNNVGLTSSIAEVIVYPNYGGSTVTGFSSPDIAILRFSTPITGTDPTFGTSITVGENVTSVGYGQTGYSGGSFSTTGDLLGWNAPVISETSGAFNTDYYGNTRFSSALDLYLNGRLGPADSGSPMYNSLGELVGMNIGSSPTPSSTQSIGSTIFLDLTNQEVASWVRFNTNIPEPTTVALSGMGLALLLRRKRKDNPLFPRLRSGHRHLQRLSPQKQIPSNDHSGTIEALAAEPSGTTFRIELPCLRS